MAKLAPNIPPLPTEKSSQQQLARLLLILRKGQKRGYGSCFSVHIEKTAENTSLLQPLNDLGIIELRKSHKGDYAVVVINRYVFERFIWEVYKVTNYSELAMYADHISPNVVVYSTKYGVGFINGNFINFRRKQNKKNKHLFDALYNAAPNEVNRKKLMAIIKQDNLQTSTTAYALSEAFTNLRKVLNVNSQIIQLQDWGKLNALTFNPDENLIKRISQR